MSDDAFQGWAVMEVMGHRRVAGWVSETTLAGAGVLRVDVPMKPRPDDGSTGASMPDDVAYTQYYPPSSLYCLSPTSETLARETAARLAPVRISALALAAPDDDPLCQCGHLRSAHFTIADDEGGCGDCDCDGFNGDIPF